MTDPIRPASFGVAIAEPPLPLTVALILCQSCDACIDVAVWRGKDALPVVALGVRESVRSPGVTWCVSHGICDDCLEKGELVEASPAVASGLVNPRGRRSPRAPRSSASTSSSRATTYVHPEAREYHRHFVVSRFEGSR